MATCGMRNQVQRWWFPLGYIDRGRFLSDKSPNWKYFHKSICHHANDEFILCTAIWWIKLTFRLDKKLKISEISHSNTVTQRRMNGLISEFWGIVVSSERGKSIPRRRTTVWERL